MFILHDILEKLKKEFAYLRKGEECGTWFIYTLIAREHYQFVKKSS